MPRTITLAIAALFSNLLLFYLMMVVENRDGFLLIFKALRVILVTSVIMQMLIAIGVVKLRQLK